MASETTVVPRRPLLPGFLSVEDPETVDDDLRRPQDPVDRRMDVLAPSRRARSGSRRRAPFPREIPEQVEFDAGGRRSHRRPLAEDPDFDDLPLPDDEHERSRGPDSVTEPQPRSVRCSRWREGGVTSGMTM